jgi:hypothetical protein
MTAPLVFTLPLPVNLGNGRMHWRTKYASMKSYWCTLDCMLIAKRLPPRPKAPYARAHLDVAMHHNRDMDHDGAEARLKWPLDWLVTRGYLVDDSPRHIERAGLVQQVRCVKNTDRKLVLTLTPIAEAA